MQNTRSEAQPIGEAAPLIDTVVTEQELTARLSTGDKAAFELVFRRYSGYVRRIASEQAREDELDDIVQETFKELFLQCVRGKGPTKALGQYLATIARRRSGYVLQQRLQGSARGAEENKGKARPAIYSVEHTSECGVQYREDVPALEDEVTGDVWVAAALAGLNQSEMLVVGLFQEGRSWEEIGQILVDEGFLEPRTNPTEAARSRYRRATDKLRKFCGHTKV